MDVETKMADIVERLTKMKFKRKLFGVDEADVWRKIALLDKEYQTMLKVQKDFYIQQIEALKNEKKE